MFENIPIEIYLPSSSFITIVDNNWNLRFDSLYKVLCNHVRAKSVTAHLYTVVEISITVLLPFFGHNSSKHFPVILERKNVLKRMFAMIRKCSIG